MIVRHELPENVEGRESVTDLTDDIQPPPNENQRLKTCAKKWRGNVELKRGDQSVMDNEKRNQ